MEDKNSTEILSIKRLEILISRLPRSFPKLENINNDLQTLYKKRQLKEQIEQYLTYLPKHFIILHDVCLKNINLFHIDYLITTPHALFIVQIEDVNPNFNFLSPLTTTYHHHLKRVKIIHNNLIRWLMKRKLHFMPVYFLIVICNSRFPHTITNTQLTKSFTIAKHLPKKLIQFYKHIQAHNKEDKNNLKRILNYINDERTNCQSNIFNKYDLNRSHILTGVRCNRCYMLAMEYVRGSWLCCHCKFSLKNAHKKTLKECYILLNRSVSLRDYRWFLKVKSLKTVKHLLKKERFTHRYKLKTV